MAYEDLTDDDETVIGVVVGIEGSNLEDVDPSVTPIDTSDELLTGFLLCDTGFASSVLDNVDSKVSLLPLLLETLWLSEDESLVEVGSGDASVMPVLLDKLGDGESVAYDVEKELLTVLVAVVGVTVGMDDKAEEDDIDKVLSFASLLLLSPPAGFLVASSATDDELSTEDDNDELSRALDLIDDVVYLRLVVDSENLVSVTAMVVPVDLPGVKVIVSGNLLLVVERTDEVIPFEDDCDDRGVVLR